jgi:hypothetical protein
MVDAGQPSTFALNPEWLRNDSLAGKKIALADDWVVE